MGKFVVFVPYGVGMLIWLLYRKIRKQPDPTKEEWIVFTICYGLFLAVATQIYMYLDGRPVTEDSLVVSAMFGLVGVVYLFGVSPFLKSKS
jgi:hypothetical protein